MRRPSRMWWVLVCVGLHVCGAPAWALEWTVLGPLPSPPADVAAPALAESEAGAVLGLHGPITWTPPVADPIAVRAATRAGPGGTFYLRTRFESAHSGPVAVRIRTTAAVRVWLDGRLIGGRQAAARWVDAPLRLPGALTAGAHQLQVELRPAADQPVWLAGALTTPDGQTIDLRAASDATALQAAAIPDAPIALADVSIPSTVAPRARWSRPVPAEPPTIDAPTLPPIEALRALARWPDAPWELLADHRRWSLDTRGGTRQVVVRVNSTQGAPAAAAFLARFDAVEADTPDGWLPHGRVAAAGIYRASMQTPLPADPLALGFARLAPLEAPVWRWLLEVDAPRDWALAVRSRGIGGVRVVDERTGRRLRRFEQRAVTAEARLRVSRAKGAAGFAAHAQTVLRDQLRPYPGQPGCDEPLVAPTLPHAMACARAGRSLHFVRAPGRAPIEGPVDLDDFDALWVAAPDDSVAWAVGLDGRIHRGRGVRRLSATLAPDQNAPARLPLGGPCGDGDAAPRGELLTERTVTVAGLTYEAPKARRLQVGPLAYQRGIVTRPAGWVEELRFSWRDLDRWSPRRIARFCRALEAMR